MKRLLPLSGKTPNILLRMNSIICFFHLREKEFHFTIPTNEENKAKNLDRLEAYAIRMSKHTKSLLTVVFGEYKTFDETPSPGESH